jgi:hypothetical protein
MLEDNEFLMRCSCGDRVLHVAWLVHEPDDDLGYDTGSWYLYTSLDVTLGFWRRLWISMRYVFQPRTLRYFGYSELVLRNEDVDALVAFILKHRRYSK